MKTKSAQARSLQTYKYYITQLYYYSNTKNLVISLSCLKVMIKHAKVCFMKLSIFFP